MSLMLHQSASEAFLKIAEDWLLECYDEDGDGIEPEYIYMHIETAEVLYGSINLADKFHITKFPNGMVKLLPKEVVIAH